MALSNKPYDEPDDLGHVIVFLLAVFLAVGVGSALYFGYDWVIRGSSQSDFNFLAGARAGSPQPTSTGTPTWTPTPDLDATATAVAEATPEGALTPVLQLARVGNTDGDGVYIRNSPSDGDRLLAWPDNTVMVLLGPRTESEGRLWIAVRDPRGNEGWVPAQYLIIEER